MLYTLLINWLLRNELYLYEYDPSPVFGSLFSSTTVISGPPGALAARAPGRGANIAPGLPPANAALEGALKLPFSLALDTKPITAKRPKIWKHKYAVKYEMRLINVINNVKGLLK